VIFPAPSTACVISTVRPHKINIIAARGMAQNRHHLSLLTTQLLIFAYHTPPKRGTEPTVVKTCHHDDSLSSIKHPHYITSNPSIQSTWRAYLYCCLNVLQWYVDAYKYIEVKFFKGSPIKIHNDPRDRNCWWEGGASQYVRIYTYIYIYAPQREALCVKSSTFFPTVFLNNRHEQKQNGKTYWAYAHDYLLAEPIGSCY